jgi:hypothetical protein
MAADANKALALTLQRRDSSRRQFIKHTLIAGGTAALVIPGSKLLAQTGGNGEGSGVSNAGSATELGSIGQALEARLLTAIDTTPIERYSDLLDLTNLAGESTGYCKVFTGEKLVKGSMFSVSIPPIGRYFNIHLIPDPKYRIPRFSYEGMLTIHGSQASIDLYPDIDVVMDLDNFEAQYRGIEEIYAEAQKSDVIRWQPAEQAFLRAIFSPFALLSFTIPQTALGAMERYADGYFAEWLKMYEEGEMNSAADAAYVTERRTHMQVVMRDRDPNVDGVIALYGEEKTRAIQDATLL